MQVHRYDIHSSDEDEETEALPCWFLLSCSEKLPINGEERFLRERHECVRYHPEHYFDTINHFWWVTIIQPLPFRLSLDPIWNIILSNAYSDFKTVGCFESPIDVNRIGFNIILFSKIRIFPSSGYRYFSGSSTSPEDETIPYCYTVREIQITDPYFLVKEFLRYIDEEFFLLEEKQWYEGNELNSLESSLESYRQKFHGDADLLKTIDFDKIYRDYNYDTDYDVKKLDIENHITSILLKQELEENLQKHSSEINKTFLALENIEEYVLDDGNIMDHHVLQCRSSEYKKQYFDCKARLKILHSLQLEDKKRCLKKKRGNEDEHIQIIQQFAEQGNEEDDKVHTIQQLAVQPQKNGKNEK